MIAEILIVAALLLGPGVGAALAFAPPGAIAIETRIALAFGLGYAVVAGAAALLALARVFERPVFVAAVVAATCAVWALALRRASLRAHLDALRAQAREAPFALAAGLALLLSVALTRPLYPAERSLAIRSSWRYWSDSLEVAAAGRVPPETQQWGIEFPTTVSKVVLNAFGGGVSMVVGPDPLPAMQAILVFTTVGFVAALLALGVELGLRVFAPLVPVLVVLVPTRLPLSQEIANDLRFYTAENMGRLGAFSALLVGIYAVRRRSRAAAVLTGLLFTVAGLSHLVPALIAGLILVLWALATAIADRGLLRPTLLAGGIALAAFAVSYAAVIGGSGGDLGFQRATRGATESTLPPNVDPTRSFVHADFEPPRAVEGAFLITPVEIVRRFGEQAVDGPIRTRYTLLGLAAVLLLAVALAFVERSFFPLSFIVCGLIATVLAVAFLFSFRYDTVIPGDWGTRRLYGYVGFVWGLLVPALLEVASRPLTRRSKPALAGLTLLVGLLAVGATLDRVPRDRSLARAEAGLAAIEHVAATVPCDARMLSNARTAGTWEATTGRRALTEGHALYLRPQLLERVLPVLIDAREFFADPAANASFLAEQEIEYIVVVEPDVWVGTAGPPRPVAGDAEEVAEVPGLEMVARNPWVTIFAVSERSQEAVLPPRRCPL